MKKIQIIVIAQKLLTYQNQIVGRCSDIRRLDYDQK